MCIQGASWHLLWERPLFSTVEHLRDWHLLWELEMGITSDARAHEVWPRQDARLDAAALRALVAVPWRPTCTAEATPRAAATAAEANTPVLHKVQLIKQTFF